MKKRILSALLALCMVFALGTVGAMATDEPVMEPGTTGRTLYVSEDGVDSGAATDATTDFKWLGAAINNAKSGDTIIVQYSFTAGNNNVTPGNDPTGIYNINKGLTIKGEGNVTITAGGSNTNRDIHLFNITSGEVTIENITIAGANTTSGHPIKHGIHVYDTADVTLKNVTVNNCYGYGLVVNNGGSVEADGFTASGNGWGGVNVDAKSGQASLTMTDSTVTNNGSNNAISVVLDSGTDGENTVKLNGGTYNTVMTNTREGDKERSVGQNDITISGSTVGTVSINGTGDDTVEIVNSAKVTEISGTNNENGTSISVTNSTVTTEPNLGTNVKITYVNSSVGGKDNVTSDGIVATIGSQGFNTLKAALEAANGMLGTDTVVIELLENDSSLGQISMTLKRDIQINGAGNTVTVSPANTSSTTKAFTLQGATLTLNNVKMNISGTQSSNNTGYDGTAFDVQNNGSELKLIGGTKLTLDKLESAIVFTTEAPSADNMGKLTMDGDSTLTITTIDGNVSNGGVWNINGSDITVNGCGSHALSTEKFTASGDSKISVTGAGMFALYGTVIDLRDSAELTVTNCGSKIDGKSGYSEPNYKYQSPIQVKSTGKIIGSPSMTIAENAEVTVAGTRDDNNTIFVPNNATYESESANVNATIKTPAVGEEGTPNIFVITYMDGDTKYHEETVQASEASEYQIISKPAGSDGWKINGQGTLYNGGEKYTPTGNVTFTAVYTEPETPTYTISVNASGGTITTSPASPVAADRIVTLTLTASSGYTVNGATVTVKDASNQNVTVSGSGATRTFTMPASDVTVTVTFKATSNPEEPAKSYSIVKNPTSHGSISAPTSGTAGEYYVVTFIPDNGYKLNTFSFTAADGSYVSRTQIDENTYSVRMPDAVLYITATFKLDNEFDINLSYNRNYGSVTARVDGDVTYVAQEYDKVYIYTEPNKGYMVKDITVSIDTWDEVEVELEREGVYSFRMPDADVEVEVTFAPGYEITIDDDIRYGEITTDPEDYAAEDDTVEVYFKPSNGYKLKTIEVFTGKDFDDEVTVRLHSSGDYYRFTMPDGDVYITAEFERTTMPFTDVRTTDWYYDEVLYVYNNGLMEGVSSYSFNPSGTMTREMFWAVLGRIDGQSITGTNWASQARSWAMNEGVSDGTNPTSLITREEMVTMLWRYAGSRAASGGLSRFNDASTISSWASTAMSWAVNNGIIDGVTSNTIQPRGTADRAQCAAIFMRYDQM